MATEAAAMATEAVATAMEAVPTAMESVATATAVMAAAATEASATEAAVRAAAAMAAGVMEAAATEARTGAGSAARGNFPKPSSSHSQQRQRPSCLPIRNASTACWGRTRRLRPAELQRGHTMKGDVWTGKMGRCNGGGAVIACGGESG